MVREVTRPNLRPAEPGVETTSEPSSRSARAHERSTPPVLTDAPRRYVVDIVSFSGSNDSPFFHSRSV